MSALGREGLDEVGEPLGAAWRKMGGVRMRAAVWFGLAGLGCSLLVPLDVTGGKAPAASTEGGDGSTASGSGGVLGVGGARSGGGTLNESGAPSAGSGPGGAAPAGGSSGATGGHVTAEGGDTGASGEGGMAGEPDDGGEGPSGGSSSGATAGAGGTAGLAGGAGSSGTGGCPGVSLADDPAHCGSCTNECAAGDECIDGVCVSSPCDGLCSTWLLPDSVDNGGPRNDHLPITDVCVEVASYEPDPNYLPAFNCWNAQGRVVDVNGDVQNCNKMSHLLEAPKRKGGYCVRVSATNTDNGTGFIMPVQADDCCKAP